MKNWRRQSKLIAVILMVAIAAMLAVLGANLIASVAIGILIGIAYLILNSSLGNRIQGLSNTIAYVLIGLAIAVLIIFAIPAIGQRFQGAELVYGFVGGERYDLLVHNPQTQKLLAENGLKITESSTTKKGSISQLKAFENSNQDLDNLDYLWTGDSAIAEAGKTQIESQGVRVESNEATLQDPLVLVVDRTAADQLRTSGFFDDLSSDTLKNSGFSYSVDTVKFVDLLTGNLSWQDVGLTRYASPPGVIISDAKKSNGGLMAETLIATVYYNLLLEDLSENPTLQTSSDITQFQFLPGEMPPQLQQTLQQLRLRSGYAESTSSKLQTQLEEGGSPWTLTYYSLGQNIIKDNPQFTLVALSHTLVNSNQFLSLSETGTKLLRIIQSPEFEAIAAEYGYNAPRGEWIVLPDPSIDAINSLLEN